MTEVISVRFRGGCKNYYFDPAGNQVKMGDQVIVETAAGIEFATCTEGNHEVEDSAIVKPLSPMVRLATDADRRTVENNRKREERRGLRHLREEDRRPQAGDEAGERLRQL